MLNEQMNDRIKALPLVFPYADYDALHALPSVDARYIAGNEALTPTQAKSFNIPEDHIPELAAARWKAGEYVIMCLKRRKISYREASEKSGITATLFSKFASGDRPFTPLPGTLIPFCYNVMGESCQKVMFGEEGRITLPSLYAEIVKTLLKADPEDNRTLLKQANEIIRKNPVEPELIDLVQERIMQYCNEKGRRFSNFFGEVTERQIQNRLFQVFKKENPSVPKIPYLMFLSFESGQALDYYISPNCLDWVPVYYEDGGNLLELKDEAVKAIISRCFGMNRENRREFLPLLLKNVFDETL